MKRILTYFIPIFLPIAAGLLAWGSFKGDQDLSPVMLLVVIVSATVIFLNIIDGLDRQIVGKSAILRILGALLGAGVAAVVSALILFIVFLFLPGGRA